ncbi:MAG: hypothetical protein ACJAYA_001277 [Bacteroidia bacterium]|jgi:hypothetical protein
MGKKFKIRQFKAMLQKVQSLPVDAQFEKAQKTLANWQGDLEQVDDIVLMGVRIS